MANLHTDFCYLLDDLEVSQKPKNNPQKSIGIIVRDWNHTENGSAYYESISTLYTQLENIGYKPTLIIFSKKTDIFWAKRKKQFASILVWEPEFDTFKNFISNLNSFDLIVTTRFHGAIFSILKKTFYINCR